ncbi:flavodoxin family protein [Phaeacidiphilus oryzae]|jgi:flavodoxin|uniref:flavodoxin family protein n=1 Tax=Phaeacidiphilus oryzae TaxID=348818 RepID=UPI00068C432E|nr:flavodoxin family protein [Phaeacidiphilus oryzae]
MKAVIVCVSESHGNTRRVAQAMGEVLDAPVVDPAELDPAALAGYDLVGFGSGIFQMNFHRRLRDFVDALPHAPEGRSTRAFLLATSGLPEPRPVRYVRRLTRRVEAKGLPVLDAFTCRGFDTWAPFKPFGGLHKDRPHAGDLAAAQAFAQGLRKLQEPPARAGRRTAF